MQTELQISEVQVSYDPNILRKLHLENSRKSFELMLDQWQHNTIEMQEEVKVILLNRTNKVLGIYSLAKGGITACVVDVRIILSVALKTLATGIIMVHNHPSGNLKPSQDDLNITKKLKEACNILDIALLDHLIITKDDYFRFADEGLL